VDDEEELEKYSLQIVDRFGILPKVVSNLILSVRFKIAAQNIFAEKVKTNGEEVHLYFNNDLGEQFYQAKTFTNILAKINTLPSHFSFKQGKTHLILVVKGFANYQEILTQIRLLKV
jgi:transcription-repair coupling factor (superfamily II helicase)